MDYKFGHDELMTIAGANSPEKIAERLLYMRDDLDDEISYQENLAAMDENTRSLHGSTRNGHSAEQIEEMIAADEDRLMTLVLVGKTRLPPKGASL